ncbi:serine palmitoyltransferase component [Cryptotrichosporon argae]
MGRSSRSKASASSPLTPSTSTPASPPSKLFGLRSRSSPTPSAPSASGSPGKPKFNARSSLINVLQRPRHPITAVTYESAGSSHRAGAGGAPAIAILDDDGETEVSDQSTISSYASSIGSLGSPSRSPSADELEKMYAGYLEKPFGNPKTVFKHSEFGHCNNPNWRWTSQYHPGEPIHTEEHQPPYYILLATYVSYIILIVFGHMRDFFGKRFIPSAYAHLQPHDGYAALNSDFDSFYTRRLKARLDDCFSRPVSLVPGRTLLTLDRTTTDFNHTFSLAGTTKRALNISSYNYLGFASSSGGCADAAEAAIRRYGPGSMGTRHDASTLDLHVACEKLVARFLGAEAAMVVSMGFATNSTTIPALVDKGCLVISDELNHASIRFGVRLSGAMVRTFKHNDMADLERLLRDAISQGQPRTHRPWKKILLVVEGLYSMEGNIVDLPTLLDLKAKYKFYLYLDEAHSMGAMGPHGRGVCDYFGIDPREIDVLMGTFTKSFGAAGGYIGGSRELIDRLKVRSHAFCYAESMSPPVIAQIMASMAAIMGVAPPLAPAAGLVEPAAMVASDAQSVVSTASSRAPAPGPAPASALPPWIQLPTALLNGTEGREKLRRLAFNSRYFSSGLRKLGFIVYGHRDSPIVPLLLYNPGKMGLFSRLMMDRVGPEKTPVAVVLVAYPATPLITSRVRFCLSASFTKYDVDIVLRACDEIGDLLDLKHGPGERWSIDRVIASAEELVAADVVV